MKIDYGKVMGVLVPVVLAATGYNAYKTSEAQDRVTKLESQSCSAKVTCDCRNAKPVIIEGLKAK
jgi:hypothetical protein